MPSNAVSHLLTFHVHVPRVMSQAWCASKIGSVNPDKALNHLQAE